MINVRLEIIAATDIKDAARETCKMAKRLKIGVVFNFNGCELTANEYTRPDQLMAEYETYLHSPLKF